MIARMNLLAINIGTLPTCSEVVGQRTTCNIITRRQDLQDAFDRHAPLTRHNLAGGAVVGT